MKHILALIVFACLFSVQSTHAQSVTGTGFGKTLDEAKKEALAELSQNIRVEVKSEFSSTQTQRNTSLDELKIKIIHLKSDLPILGAQFSSLTSMDGFMVDAILNSSATVLYEKELQKTADLIAQNITNLEKKISNAAKVKLLQGILAQIEQYYKLRIVAQFLKSNAIPEISVTTDDIAGRLSALEKKADTLDFGIRILARNFDGKNLYIYPPTAEQSNEVTQFGRAVKDHLATVLKTCPTPDKADLFITGSYKILNNGVELTCHLTDKTSNTLKTGLVFFLPSAYEGYTVKPLSLDFEKLVQAGYVLPGNFRVDLKTEKGKHDLLYTRGDTMKLLVKLNKPGYFYLVSHNIKENGTYSYIIHFTDDAGDRKFVYYVDGDAVNKWLELGEFDVVPPFGVETLQMVAATDDLISRVPQNYLDTKTGLYTIGETGGKNRGLPVPSKPEKALTSTRGLMMKKQSAVAEAVLMFTSMNAN
ncbi:MAG: DUF4384 domain-containing protein [Proteobacteria bacterium]|nr:DUF4384 domain-containing protein [Pseudomonadota bacterium]